MSDRFVFEYQEDFSEKATDFSVTDTQYVSFNTMNQNYAQNIISFTNVSISSSQTDKMFVWKEGILFIPYSVVLRSSDTATFDPATCYQFAMSHKGFHTFIDEVTVKINGIQVTKPQYMSPLWRNEVCVKNTSEEKYKTWTKSVLQYAFDTHDTVFMDVAGEQNGTTVTNNNLQAQSTVRGRPNQGHLERCRLQWKDATDPARSSNGIFTGQTVTRTSIQQESNIVYVDAHTIVWSGFVTLPLPTLHSWFENCPSLLNAASFEINLRCNFGAANSYIVNYAQDHSLVSCTANQASGTICPFMISNNPSADGSTGMKVMATAPYALSLTSTIGWNLNQIPNWPAGLYQGMSTVPPRVTLPTINYNPTLLDKLLHNSLANVKYEDISLCKDPIGLRYGQVPVSVLIPSQIVRAKRLWIIPFIAGSVGHYPAPYQSPLSSAPNTCSPCKLRNVFIQIGGRNITQENMNTDTEFFDRNAAQLSSFMNGNAYGATLQGGMITRQMFTQGAYCAYSFNLNHSLDENQHVQAMSITVNYTIDCATTTSYEMWYMVESDVMLQIDRTTANINS